MKILILTLILILPTFTYAQYVPIVNIPGITGTPDINSYINALYILAITVAALLAVIKIIIAGVKWMTTDIVTSKGEAKKDIQGALVGLLVIMGAVLIIEVINPDIGTVELNFEDVTTPEPLPGPTPTDELVETCTESSTCEVMSCTETDAGPPPVYDCTTRRDQCEREGGIVNTSVGDNRILCVKAGAESPVEREASLAEDTLRAFIAENDEYTEVIGVYAINERDQTTNTDLTPTDLAAMVDDWADDCELNADGSDTGYTYEEVEDTVRGVMARACFN